MAVTTFSSKNQLPTDPEKLRAYSWELTLAYQALTEKFRKLLKSQFGRSTEKLNDHSQLDALQLEMDALLNQVQAAEEQRELLQQETVEVVSHQRLKRKHPGRNAIPEELITDQTLDVPETEKTCSCCGDGKKVIDTKQHVVIERIPAQYRATRYLRPVYACPRCKDGVSVMEAPLVTPINKGLAGPQLLSFVFLSKYNYHLPLYRIQRQIYHESRIWFTRSTLVSWIRGGCELLMRIHRVLLIQYQKSRIKHADETPFQVKVDGKYRQAYMWVGLTGDGRIAVFLYNRHRSGEAALKLLDGSSRGDYLMTDDCASYNKPRKRFELIELRCMVHIRRKFIEAKNAKSHLVYINRILIKIGQLYRIERIASRLGASSERRGELRSRYSVQIMEQIKTLLENPGFTILPRSPLGEARTHFLKNWTAATRFLGDGTLPIDNSANERAIRPFTIGRNNWLQAGSENGARWMAILYTIISTCKLNDIDPHEYLSEVLMRLAARDHNADVSDLTPVEWYKEKNGGYMPAATPLYPSKN